MGRKKKEMQVGKQSWNSYLLSLSVWHWLFTIIHLMSNIPTRCLRHVNIFFFEDKILECWSKEVFHIGGYWVISELQFSEKLRKQYTRGQLCQWYPNLCLRPPLPVNTQILANSWEWNDLSAQFHCVQVLYEFRLGWVVKTSIIQED